MSFGLKNVLIMFQRTLDMILVVARWKNAIVYLDAIIIFNNMVEDHLVYFKSVLPKLQEAGLSLKFKKFFFMIEKVEYLGHVGSPGKL